METEELQLRRWQSALEGFDSVWTRVAGRTEARPLRTEPLKTPALAELAAEAGRAAMYDRALALCFRGESRSLLQRHARQAERRARRLRAEAFLADGVRRIGAESCPRPDGALDGLRSAMLRDGAAAKTYAGAAEAAGGELRAVLSAFAEETEAAAAEKRRLILRCFAG